jgi:hypothetical protein
LAHDGGAVPGKEKKKKVPKNRPKPAELIFSSSAGFFCFWDYGIIGG